MKARVFLRCSGVLLLLVTLLGSAPVSRAQFGYSLVDAFGEVQFTHPVGIVTAPGDTNRVFVLERRGVISVITNVANPDRTTFMDISARVTVGTGTGDERGLLGLAFHPGYLTNRYFFVFYTTGGLLDRLSRFQINPSNANMGLEGTEVVLIDQPDDAGNHNGGDLHFGPDGYLYVSLGDEGDANDTRENSQRINKDFFSGILRLDVDKRPGSLAPNSHPASSTNYAIPPDNPFVGATSFNGSPVAASGVRTEFWAVGLRNPWRMSFDSVTGFLYVGDVGQGAREEIDVIVKGGNYGWNFREGLIAGPEAPPAGFTGAIDPIQDYPRSGTTNHGSSVTGGVVYRGGSNPDLYGDYVFADYVSGNLWALNYDGMNTEPYRHLLTYPRISAFGVDPANGDVLVADLVGGRVKRLIFTEPSALTVEIVAAGSVWKYRDTGVDQGVAWREPAFDDSAWAAGPAELGNGDGGEATPINIGPSGNRHRTIYFRHEVVVPDPSLFTSLDLAVLRDDGVVVYLNGMEVFRDNLPPGEILYSTLALVAIADGAEREFVGSPVDRSLLVPGTNVVAVEIHQQSVSSSDVSFDLRLYGGGLPELAIGRSGGGVTVSWPAPAPGFALEGTSIADLSAWAVVGAPIRDGDRNNVMLPISGEGRVFRLVRQDPLSVLAPPQSEAGESGEDPPSP